MLAIKLLFGFNCLFIVIISINLVDAADFKLAYEYARKIYNEHANLTLHEIILNLSQIKPAIKNSVYLDVPKNLPLGVDRNVMIYVLILERLVDVHSALCLRPRIEISNENFHKLNYFELEHFARNLLPKDDNIQRIIKEYFFAQLNVCRRGLVAHIELKWRKLIRDHPRMVQTRQYLMAYFPASTPIKQLTQEQKLNGLLQFMKQSLGIDHELVSEQKIQETYAILKTNDCEDKIENAFYTLMMTYNKTGRIYLQNVERYHGQLIRLYDLCSVLPSSIKELGFGDPVSK